MAGDFDRISASVQQIDDISERVKVLSINASIEAARAGVAGRGFKVIAGEVQKLSWEVQQLVTAITREIRGTQSSLNAAVTHFDQHSQEISQDLSTINQKLSAYDGNLEHYQKAFSEIVSTVTEFSGEMTGHIDSLNPLFQLQDMTVQQIEHLYDIGKLHHEGDGPLSTLWEMEQTRIWEELLVLAHRVTTTDAELDVIRELAVKHRIDLSKIPGTKDRNSTLIELF